jgi:hypothetical protein
MNPLEEIKAGLLDAFRGLRDGTLEVKDVVELNNTAGKYISACKVQLAENIFLDRKEPVLGVSAPTETAEPRKLKPAA